MGAMHAYPCIALRVLVLGYCRPARSSRFVLIVASGHAPSWAPWAAERPASILARGPRGIPARIARAEHRTAYPTRGGKCPPLLHLWRWYACGLHGGEGRGDDGRGAAATAARAREDGPLREGPERPEAQASEGAPARHEDARSDALARRCRPAR